MKQPGKKTRKQKVAESKQYLTCRAERTPEELVKALNEMPDTECEMIGCDNAPAFSAGWFDGTTIQVCRKCRDYHFNMGSIRWSRAIGRETKYSGAQIDEMV